MVDMKKIVFIVLFLSVSALYATMEAEGASLAAKLKLNAASKAMVQWERVFKNKRKMKRYKIDTLSNSEREILKKYLIDHAIDSDHPTVAGV